MCAEIVRTVRIVGDDKTFEISKVVTVSKEEYLASKFIELTHEIFGPMQIIDGQSGGKTMRIVKEKSYLDFIPSALRCTVHIEYDCRAGMSESYDHYIKVNYELLALYERTWKLIEEERKK